jgi:hypothetical protein
LHYFSLSLSLSLFSVHNDKVPDPSSTEVIKVEDIQGIAWEKLPITRENYRLARLEQYKNYENVPNSSEEATKVCL